MSTTVTIDADLDGLLDELAETPELAPLAGVLRTLVTTQHSLMRLQAIVARLAGIHDGNDAVGAIGLAVQNLASPDHQPAVAELPARQQKNCQQWGERTAFLLLDDELRTPAAETCAAIADI